MEREGERERERGREREACTLTLVASFSKVSAYLLQLSWYSLNTLFTLSSVLSIRPMYVSRNRNHCMKHGNVGYGKVRMGMYM